MKMCKHRADAAESHSGPFNDRSVFEGFEPETNQKLTQSSRHKMSTDSIKPNCFNWGHFQTTANIKEGNYRWMNIDPTVVGDIITHERTTWTKGNHEVKNRCVGGEGSFAEV